MSLAEAIARVLPTVVAIVAVWAYEIRFPVGPAMIVVAVAVDVWRWRWLSRRPPAPLTRRAARMPELVILFLYVAVFGTLALAILVEHLGGRACLPELQAAIGTIFNTADRQVLRAGGYCDGPLAAPTYVMLVTTPISLTFFAIWKALIYDRNSGAAVRMSLLPLTVPRSNQTNGVILLSLLISIFFFGFQKVPYVISEDHIFSPSDRIDGLIASMLMILFSILAIHSILWAEASREEQYHV